MPSPQPVDPDYTEYLRDESRLVGQAASISFPLSEDEVRRILKDMAKSGTPVTVQGGRTGIAAGAVPQGGHILNLSRMNRFLGLRCDPSNKRFLLRVQPGVLLAEINEALNREELPTEGWSAESLESLEKLRSTGPYFFAPDPTETSASVGGMTASNASGARTFLYGATRRYVQSLRLVLSDGSIAALRRGAQKAEGLHFRYASDSGRVLEGDLCSYTLPATKNTAGFYCRPDMDLIDLIIGSEGTLGVLSEIELVLLPRPACISAVLGFFPEAADALQFVKRIRMVKAANNNETPAAIEFFDRFSLELLRDQKMNNPAFQDIPEVPEGQGAAVYVEYHGRGEQEVEERIYALAETLVESGGEEEATWLAEHPKDLERLKSFRHALPEAVNLLIDERRKGEPGLTKLGTDMAVPDEALDSIVTLYVSDLTSHDLDYVMFGHIGDNHIHVNILPRTLEEYRLGRKLYERWAEVVVSMGGTVSAEHGIGKLKVELLRRMYGSEGLEEMRRIIEVFNPGFLLNRGNIVGKGRI